MDKKRRIIQMAAYTVALLIVAGLSVALALTLNRQKHYEDTLENIYQKSYYETMDSISNIETKLDKLSIIEGKTMQKAILGEVWRECELAESNFAQLSSRNDSVESIIKFFNQLGDYCYYLSSKIDNENISDTENERLDKFAEMAEALRAQLQVVQAEIMKGGTLRGDFNQELNYFTEAFNTYRSSSIDVPELIYDGPFSDGLTERKPKALEGLSEIDKDAAKQKIEQFFEGQDAVATLNGETSGNIPSFLFDVKVGGKTGNIQLSVKGGKPVMYDCYKEVGAPVLSEDECIAKADDFLKAVGYDNMEAVWVTNNNSTVYINFAYVQNDVIIYPDLIKVKVACDNGDILGLEAQNYLYNHTNRTLAMADTSYVPNSKLKVISKKLALIPTEWHTEKMAVEFICTRDEDIYYIYVNTDTDEEERVLVVIDDNGRMLI